MAYNKRVWGSDEVITKEALNNIENGIEAVEQSIPKLVSQLTNDAGYITEHLDLSNYAEKDELHEHNNKDVLDGINLVRVQAWDNAANKEDVNLDDYALKSEIPVIPELPTKVSELENDLGYLTEDTLPLQTIPSNLSELNNDTNFITLEDVPACLITEEEKEEMNNRVKALEEVEHVSLEQYNALLERVAQLEEALAALSPSEPGKENPEDPGTENPVE